MSEFGFFMPQKSHTDEFIPVSVQEQRHHTKQLKDSSMMFERTPQPSTSTVTKSRTIENPVFETESSSFPLQEDQGEDEMEKVVEILSKPRVETDEDAEMEPKTNIQENIPTEPKSEDNLNMNAPIETPEPKKSLNSPTITSTILKNPESSQLGTPMPRFSSPSSQIQKKNTDMTNKNIYFLWDFKKIVADTVTYKNIGFSFLVWVGGIMSYIIISSLFFQDVGLHNKIYVLSLLAKRFTSGTLVLVLGFIFFLLFAHFLKFIFFVMYCGWRKRNIHLDTDAPLHIPSIKLLVFPIVDFACEIFDVTFSWYLESLTFRPTRAGYYVVLEKMFLAFFITSILYVMAANLRFHTFLLLAFFMLMTLPIMLKIFAFLQSIVEDGINFLADNIAQLFHSQTKKSTPPSNLFSQPQQPMSTPVGKEVETSVAPQTPMMNTSFSNPAVSRSILTPTPLRPSFGNVNMATPSRQSFF